MADASGGPTALRIVLGSQLRRLRTAKGITVRAAAHAIGGTDSKISRMELGRSGVREFDVADLLTLYGITDPVEREQLLSLAAEANKPGWWHRYNDILPEWLQSYIGLEEAAESIRTYQAQFIPGLLQTEDYATAVIALEDFTSKEAERRVDLRRRRQNRFRDGHLRLWAVIDEAALRRPIGGAPVMRAQLDHLLDADAQQNLTLQVTPYTAGGHAAPSGFSVLRFADPDLPDMVYVEHLTSALYLDKRSDVDRYLLAMERLTVVSARPDESREIIKTILEGAM